VAEERRTFAGLLIGEDELDDVAKMSLKEYLAKRDTRNFSVANGLEDVNMGDSSKKRKYGEISKEEDGDE